MVLTFNNITLHVQGYYQESVREYRTLHNHANMYSESNVTACLKRVID